jgi:hypothetical protein
MEELDNSWIQEFEILDSQYKNFYKEDNHFIKIRFVYINNDLVIEKIKEEEIKLNTVNFLSREEMISLIKHNNIDNRKKYSLFSILKYNIDLEPSSLKTFIKTKTTNLSNFCFLSSIRNIDTIHFEPTIYMFQELNELLFLFWQPTENTNSHKTKRIFIKAKNKTIKKI